MLNLIACRTSSIDEFDKFIENKYSVCNKAKTCIVDLKQLPFKWDKFYIFSENHFPESISQENISSILGMKYNKNISSNDRLIVFIYKGKIVYEVLTTYKKENFIDSAALFVDFYIDDTTPSFFINTDAKFVIKKTNGNYILFWKPSFH